MTSRFPLLGLALAAFACTRESPPPPGGPPPVPPVLQGTYADDAGVEHTVVSIEGMLRFGESARSEVPTPDTLIGYEFEARAGVTARATVERLEGDGALGLSVHGPRDEIGLWDHALGFAEGDEAVVEIELPRTGHYVLLVRDRGAGHAPFELRLECDGECGEPSCPQSTACGLVCREGFEVDESACRLCECITPACSPEACGPDEVCGDDGHCQPAPRPCHERCADAELAPVCAAGRTRPNACVAECEGLRDFAPGECREPPRGECDADRPCPNGARCREGVCMQPSCNCEPMRQPACGHDGQTYANACELACRLGPEGLDYHGACVARRCDSEDDCPVEGDWRCAPSASVPENREFCRQPEDPRCVRECVPPPPEARGCNDDRPCPAGLICHRSGRERGICLLPCGLDRPGSCGEERVCANIHVEGDVRRIGVCLPACGEGGRCVEPLHCNPDLDGQRVCQMCPCREEDRDARVCTADGREHESACNARCAGYTELERCMPDEPPPPPPADCGCRPGPGFVCGVESGRIYASECEARCAGELAQRLVSCLGDAAPARECQVDEDCIRTGCDERFCASAPSEACARFSRQAECVAQHGRCGCVEGQCSLSVTREVEACLTPPPPPP